MYLNHIFVFDAATTAASNNSSSDTLSKVVFSVGSAVLGAALSYVVALLLARRNPHKQISWEATTDRSLLAVSSEIRDNVQISYKHENINDLVAIKCRVTNTGNVVVKNEQLRFAFPDGTRILEADFAPQPERELRASRVDLPDLKDTERMFSVGQMEASQEVSFVFMATGPRAEEWGLYHSNEEGGVDFRQRDANRIKDEQEHVRPTVIITALFLVTSTLIQAVEATDFFLSQYLAAIAVVIDLALTIALTPHVIPVARIIQRLITRWLVKPDPTTDVTIQGGGNALVATSSAMVGSVTFSPPAPDA
jgi:hypothetical protein